jgi:alkaline phosphatase
LLLLSSCASQAPAVPTLEQPTTQALSPTEVVEPTLALAETESTQAEEPPAAEAPAPTLSAAPSPTAAENAPPAVILFIGDGMGAAQRQAATWLALGQSGTLVMDSLPVRGWAQTASANNDVTDSAAAATAMATGVQTNNGMLGLDPQGNSLTTILEMAETRGMATGLVTTVQLAHATPAAFAVHVEDRDQLPEIADLMAGKEIDVLLGGGEDDFMRWTDVGCYPGIGHQPNDNDLAAEMIGRGYTYICTQEQLLGLNTAIERQVLGLFGGDEIEAPFQPTLAEMTQTALEILSQDPDGFFLMVEAGQIDWAAHNNQAEEAMRFTIDLDTAVTMALIFTLEHPNTLLIVAADHETGGMLTNLDGAGSMRQDGPFNMPDGTPFWVDWTTSGEHTGVDIPVTAQGPHSEMLLGEYPLARVFEVMRAVVEGE